MVLSLSTAASLSARSSGLTHGLEHFNLALHGVADGWSWRIASHVVHADEDVVDSLVIHVCFFPEPITVQLFVPSMRQTRVG